MLGIVDGFLERTEKSYKFCWALQFAEWSQAINRCKDSAAVPGRDGYHKERRAISANER